MDVASFRQVRAADAARLNASISDLHERRAPRMIARAAVRPGTP
jgi:hypothetical protein